MKNFLIILAFIISLNAVDFKINFAEAQVSCSTDSFGTTRCNNGQTFSTDSFGTTRDNQGNSWSTDSFGTTRDNQGNSCSTDAFGTTRCY